MLPVEILPLVGTEAALNQPPDMVQAVALAEFQIKVVDVLYGILVLAAVIETVGTGGLIVNETVLDTGALPKYNAAE